VLTSSFSQVKLHSLYSKLCFICSARSSPPPPSSYFCPGSGAFIDASLGIMATVRGKRIGGRDLHAGLVSDDSAFPGPKSRGPQQIRSRSLLDPAMVSRLLLRRRRPLATLLAAPYTFIMLRGGKDHSMGLLVSSVLPRKLLLKNAVSISSTASSSGSSAAKEVQGRTPSKPGVILSTAKNGKKGKLCSLFVCRLAVCRLLLLFRLSPTPHARLFRRLLTAFRPRFI